MSEKEPYKESYEEFLNEFNSKLYSTLLDLSVKWISGVYFSLKFNNEEKKLKAKFVKQNWVSWLEIYEINNESWVNEDWKKIFFMSLLKWNQAIWIWIQQVLFINKKDFFINKDFSSWLWINIWKSNKDYSQILYSIWNLKKISLILDSIENEFNTKKQLESLKQEMKRDYFYNNSWEKRYISKLRFETIKWIEYQLTDMGSFIDLKTKKLTKIKIWEGQFILWINLKHKIWNKIVYEFRTDDTSMFLDEKLAKVNIYWDKWPRIINDKNNINWKIEVLAIGKVNFFGEELIEYQTVWRKSHFLDNSWKTFKYKINWKNEEVIDMMYWVYTNWDLGIKSIKTKSWKNVFFDENWVPVTEQESCMQSQIFKSGITSCN